MRNATSSEKVKVARSRPLNYAAAGARRSRPCSAPGSDRIRPELSQAALSLRRRSACLSGPASARERTIAFAQEGEPGAPPPDDRSITNPIIPAHPGGVIATDGRRSRDVAHWDDRFGYPVGARGTTALDNALVPIGLDRRIP